MFDEPFRARFAPLAHPIVRRLARAGVTPNRVTVVTFVLSLAAATLVGMGEAYAGLAIWLVSRIGDGIDGALARETGRITPFGGYLDITLDMAAYGVMVLGFARLHPTLAPAWLAVLAGYVVVITTTLALSDAAQSARRQVGETDRTFQFTTGIAEAGETTMMYVLWVAFPQHLEWLVWVWVAALLVTCVQRSVLAWRVLR